MRTRILLVTVTLNPILLGGRTMSHLLRLRSRLLRGAVVLFRMMRVISLTFTLSESTSDFTAADVTVTGGGKLT